MDRDSIVSKLIGNEIKMKASLSLQLHCLVTK